MHRLPDWLRFAFLGCLAVACLSATACNRSGGGAKVHPAGGLVLFDERPVPNARVVFHRLDAAGRATTERLLAYTDAQGRFALTTHTDRDGAAPGPYLVTVECHRLVARPDGDTEPGPNLLPPKYSRPDWSDLRAEVTPAANEWTFRLTND